jgi:FKBP-type peptidyl-prolyl cis-trans isomerase 2
MAIKKNDFVEIEYTGKIKEDNVVFDTTNESIAKQSNAYSENSTYGPVVICIGENQILAGLDKNVEGKEAGKDYIISLSQDQAFGRKNPKLIQLISTNKFMQQKVQPIPGLQVFIDGKLGVIKTVSGGRTLVDFNHPLSGKDLIYDLKINRIIEDKKEKIESYVKMQLKLKKADVEVKENLAEITLNKDIREEIKKELTAKLIELTGIEKVEFKNKKDAKQ